MMTIIMIGCIPKRFALAQVVDKLPDDQGQMDSLLARIRSLPFYKGLLYNDATRASLMMVFVNAKLFDTRASRQSKRRAQIEQNSLGREARIDPEQRRRVVARRRANQQREGSRGYSL